MSPPTTRRLPLFPLPNVVHFPDTDLRLHIFEPRYRQLIHDLHKLPAAERLIGMVLLKPGWDSLEASGEERSSQPAIYQQGTAGLLVELDELEDGRSNIVLRGQYRFEVKNEFPSHPYRQANVWPLDEPRTLRAPDEAALLVAEIGDLLQSLRHRIGTSFPIHASPRPTIEFSLLELVNTVASQIDIPAQNKLDLLGHELPERAARVISILRSGTRVLDLLEPFRGNDANPELN